MLVAKVIKDHGLDLDVLSESVEAHMLCHKDVVLVGVGGGGEEDAVGVIALVKEGVQEDRFPFKRKSLPQVVNSLRAKYPSTVSLPQLRVYL